MFSILHLCVTIRFVQVILQHHSQEAEQTMESAIRLNYIETASSILHEMPWVVVKEYKVCMYIVYCILCCCIGRLILLLIVYEYFSSITVQ